MRPSGRAARGGSARRWSVALLDPTPLASAAAEARLPAARAGVGRVFVGRAGGLPQRPEVERGGRPGRLLSPAREDAVDPGLALGVQVEEAAADDGVAGHLR